MTEKPVYTTKTPRTSASVCPNRIIRVAAEFLGTLLISFAIYCVSSWSVLINSYSMILLVVLGTALAYGVVTATFGRVSGGHFNPAISFATILTGILDWFDGLLYIIAQVFGAFVGAGLWYLLTPVSKEITHKMWFSFVVNGYEKNSPAGQLLGSAGLSFDLRTTLLVELIFAILITVTFFMTLRKNGLGGKDHAIAMGSVYGLAALVTFSVDGAAQNPARSTGIAVLGDAVGKMAVSPVSQLWVFWAATFIGSAIVGFAILAYHILHTQHLQTEAMLAQMHLDEAAEDISEDDDDDEEIIVGTVEDKDFPEVIIETEESEEEKTHTEPHKKATEK